MKLQYVDGIRDQLFAELGLPNKMLVPTLEKIVVNMGVGEAVSDGKQIHAAMEDLSIITGQKPKMNRSRKSIANFKLREGSAVGCSVTMRGDRAWEFLDRLITVSIPRIRDFRGLSPKSFDGRGNYSFGVTEQLIFPEVDYDRVTAVRGMDITICTTSSDDAGGRAFLNAYGFPFRRPAPAPVASQS
jgi:large subunit ribosomal protein L5